MQRVAKEDAWLQKIKEEDKTAFAASPADSTTEQNKQSLHVHALKNTYADRAAAASHQRGVTIQWLVKWTQTHDCWDMPTWMVKRKFVMDATAALRCRYVDLPEMQTSGAVGPANTFVSHCWGAQWGTLVAAVAEGADPNRRVWIDVFAVRQWPGSTADLDFKGVIQRCTSFVLVCEHLASVSGSWPKLRSLNCRAALFVVG